MAWPVYCQSINQKDLDFIIWLYFTIKTRFLKSEQTELAEMSDQAAKMFIDKLFDSIDIDKNDMIDSVETIKWIRQLEEGYVKRDSAAVFDEFDADKNKYLSFKETMDFAEVAEADKSSKEYKRELHRFTLTDRNKDRYLSLDEFEGNGFIWHFTNFRKIVQKPKKSIPTPAILQSHAWAVHATQFWLIWRWWVSKQNLEVNLVHFSRDGHVTLDEFIREHIDMEPSTNKEDETEVVFVGIIMS